MNNLDNKFIVCNGATTGIITTFKEELLTAELIIPIEQHKQKILALLDDIVESTKQSDYRNNFNTDIENFKRAVIRLENCLFYMKIVGATHVVIDKNSKYTFLKPFNTVKEKQHNYSFNTNEDFKFEKIEDYKQDIEELRNKAIKEQNDDLVDFYNAQIGNLEEQELQGKVFCLYNITDSSQISFFTSCQIAFMQGKKIREALESI